MIHFEWPFLLLALPLPFLVRRYLKPMDSARAALRFPNFQAVQKIQRPSTPSKLSFFSWTRRDILVWVIWGLLVFSLTRPQWMDPPVFVPTTTRDVMMAIDISGSMEWADFEWHGHPIDRLSLVKTVAAEFIKNRSKERVGLILFGTRPYLVAPLTTDLLTVQHFLTETEIGLAGIETSMGDSIALAVKYLSQTTAPQKILILLTDGASNMGQLSPEAAALLAKEAYVKIYTIGVGAKTQSLRQAPQPDEKTLEMIARTTGGEYFRATDTAKLISIYQAIDRLEPTTADGQNIMPPKELFYIPLSLALLGFIVFFMGPSVLPFLHRKFFQKEHPHV